MLQHPDVRAFLRGAAVPGMLVFAFGLIGFIYGFLAYSGSFDNATSAAKTGMFLGLFASLFGVLEILVMIVVDGFDTKNWRRTGFIALGYLSIWTSCVGFIFLLYN